MSTSPRRKRRTLPKKKTGSRKAPRASLTRRAIPFLTRNIERDRRQSFRRRLAMLRGRLLSLEQRASQGTPSPKLEREMAQLEDEIQRLERRLPQELSPKWEAKEAPFEFPAGYGDHKIVLMVRDPWWLYTYWEVDREVEGRIHRDLQTKGLSPVKSILRVYDVTDILFDGTNAHAFFDMTLHSNANSWYIDVGRPNRTYLVDIGIVATDGSFHLLCRSNPVTTPRFGMSEVLDEEWMTSEEEYWRMFGLSGGYGIGKSSLELKEKLKMGLFEQVSSGASFFPAAKKEPWRLPSS